MSGLTTAELTAMRAVADDFLPDTCTVQTMTEAADATGSMVKTWANTYTSVACRVDPEAQTSGTERVTGLALEASRYWIINLKHDQAISVEYRVIHDGKTYDVVSVVDTQSYRTIRRARLVRVE